MKDNKAQKGESALVWDLMDGLVQEPFHFIASITGRNYSFRVYNGDSLKISLVCWNIVPETGDHYPSVLGDQFFQFKGFDKTRAAIRRWAKEKIEKAR